MDKSGGFIPAERNVIGIQKKRIDGVISEYNIYTENDDSDFIFDDELENMGYEPDMRTVRSLQKPKKVGVGLEYQIQSSITKQMDSYIDKVLNNEKIRVILSKKKDWIHDNDYFNVIVQKVVEASNGQLIFEEVKQSIKQRYG